MATVKYSEFYGILDYSSFTKTKVLLSGQLAYFTGVITGQVKPVHLMGDGVSLASALPFVETVEIHTSANVDLKDLRITGNRVKIYNSGSSAITVQTGVTGSLTYENINTKCTSQAFFDGTYWRVEDGAQIGDIKPWHKDLVSGLSVPWGWALFDGATISDAESPANGETLSDVNGEGRFIRGCDPGSSGIEQGHAFQGHHHETYYRASVGTETDCLASGITKSVSKSTAVENPTTDGVNGTPQTASETRPINMAAVYIIKIK